MSYADLKIVAIILIFVLSYGVFSFLYVSEEITSQESIKYEENYTSPSSAGFFGTIEDIASINFDNPELFFINIIIITTLSFLLVFIGLRFLRGQG